MEEGDVLQVCITFSGGTLSGVVAQFTIYTEDGTATVNGSGKLQPHITRNHTHVSFKIMTR